MRYYFKLFRFDFISEGVVATRFMMNLLDNVLPAVTLSKVGIPALALAEQFNHVVCYIVDWYVGVLFELCSHHTSPQKSFMMPSFMFDGFSFGSMRIMVASKFSILSRSFNPLSAFSPPEPA